MEMQSELPRDSRDELRCFILGIKDMPFLRPDGDPKEGWRVFRSSNLIDAKVAAKVAMGNAGIKSWGKTKSPAKTPVDALSAAADIDLVHLVQDDARLTHALEALVVYINPWSLRRDAHDNDALQYAVEEAEAIMAESALGSAVSKARSEAIEAAKAVIKTEDTGVIRTAIAMGRMAASEVREIINRTANITEISALLDAERDVASMARMIALKGIDFEGRDRYSRIEEEKICAWRKGYCVAGDADGTLYVYCVGDPTDMKLRK